MINFLHNYHPQPILVKLGNIQIHWYGFFLALGFLAGYFLLTYLFKVYRLDKILIDKLAIYLVFSGILGARFYYVVYAWEFYKDDFWAIFKIWQGGLAIHGAIIGGIIGLFLFIQKYKQDLILYLDILSTSLILGQIIGRWGNYFNQELYGKPTNLPWGIPIDNPVEQYQNFQYFHPVFLYEAIINFFIFIFLFYLHFYFFKKQQKPQATIFLLYLILYSINRFLMEFLRVDYSPIIFGIRWAQIISVIIILFCIFAFWKKDRFLQFFKNF